MIDPTSAEPNCPDHLDRNAVSHERILYIKTSLLWNRRPGPKLLWDEFVPGAGRLYYAVPTHDRLSMKSTVERIGCAHSSNGPSKVSISLYLVSFTRHRCSTPAALQF